MIPMNRWAIVAIPLMFCLVMMDAVVRQFAADRAFCPAKARIEEYEMDYELYLKGKKYRPEPLTSVGALLKKAVKLEPQCPEYRNYLGRWCQSQAADPHLSAARRIRFAKQAIEHYEKAVNLEPLNAEYLAYLAYLQGVMCEHQKAVANFEQAVKLNQSNKWIRNMYEAYRETVPPPEKGLKPSANGAS